MHIPDVVIIQILFFIVHLWMLASCTKFQRIRYFSSRWRVVNNGENVFGIGHDDNLLFLRS